jgi:uncharacterized beta-barrel protein YwiB (DUF1934 family)
MNEPNVLLTIEGQQWNDEEKPQAIRLTTEGRLFRKDPAWYVVYDESPATGLEGTQTTMQVADDGSVSLIRKGSHGMHLTFMAGNRHITRMETPYGDLDVEVYTSLVQAKVNNKGGFINLGYSIDLNNRERMNTRLRVTIKQRPVS